MVLYIFYNNNISYYFNFHEPLGVMNSYVLNSSRILIIIARSWSDWDIMLIKFNNRQVS